VRLTVTVTKYHMIFYHTAFLVIFIHYKHVMLLLNERETLYRRLNKFSLLVGLVSAFGLMLVGSFQVTDLIIPDNFITMVTG